MQVKSKLPFVIKIFVLLFFLSGCFTQALLYTCKSMSVYWVKYIKVNNLFEIPPDFQ